MAEVLEDVPHFVRSHLWYSLATPKQIRELMRVDGLTNDEVKSHLQVFSQISKYKLHSRRVPNNSSTSTNEISNDPPKPSGSQYGSPEGPL